MSRKNGKKTWMFPDAELPPAGEFELKGHESVIVLNCNKKQAKIDMMIYFENKSPSKCIQFNVEAERVRCLRMDNPSDIGGFVIPKETQYAIRIQSDVAVVAQYGRLDTRQQNMAFYTCMGYSV